LEIKRFAHCTTTLPAPKAARYTGPGNRFLAESESIMAEMWRLFVAIELSEDVLSQIAATQAYLAQRAPAGAARWVKPGGIHLTLKFLGDVSVTKRGSLEKALAQAVQGHAPFTLAAGGLGCFPNVKRPRVVWMGIHEDLNPLHALRDAVESRVAPLGYPTEERAFSPHLTLGRARRETSPSDLQTLGELIANAPSSDRHAWTVTGVSLIRSELTASGAVYTSLFHAPLR
jgi:2'-5' RNA ligase